MTAQRSSIVFSRALSMFTGLALTCTLATACASSATDAGDTDEGAATATTECGVGADESTCKTHVHCANAVNGKNEFDVPGKLTQAQVNAKCPNDAPAGAVFSADACQGTPMTLLDLAKKKIPAGGDGAELGSYAAEVEVRHYNPATGSSPWSKPESPYTLTRYRGQEVGAGTVRVSVDSNGNPYLSLGNGADKELTFSGSNSEQVFLVSKADIAAGKALKSDGTSNGLWVEKPTVKITDRCIWIGGESRQPYSAGLQGHFGLLVQLR